MTTLAQEKANRARRKYADIQVNDRFGALIALESTEGKPRRRDMRIMVLCDCGVKFPVAPHALWRGVTSQCFECAIPVGAAKRRKIQGEQVGKRVGYYEVVAYEFMPTRGNGSNAKRHRFTLRDTRCGHEHTILIQGRLESVFPSGLRTVCGCPRRYITPHGYAAWQWTHPWQRGRQVAIFEHRIAMEQKLGRPLEDYETVHHINNNGLDNRPENLQLRIGNHGSGAVPVCHDCGSQNVGYAPIAADTAA